MPGVDQMHFKPGCVEHFEQGYPVHASGLHRHGLDTALAQPLHQALKIGGEGWEFLYWLSIAVARNGDEMAGGPNVDAAGAGVGDAQGRRL